MMLLSDKQAVIFGAGGAVGSEVARVFAREGATVFLSGRHRASVEVVAREIRTAQGKAQADEVDALNEPAVQTYLDQVAQKAGKIDIVFNAIGPQPIEYEYGTLSTEVSHDKFMLPINTLVGSQFLTARAAARHMMQQRSGVVVFITATPAQGVAPTIAGLSAAFAAVEGLTRCLATEWGNAGIRVVCVRSEAMPETRTIKQAFEILARNVGVSKDEFEQVVIEEKTLLKRLPTVTDVANVVTFAASDLASTLTGTTINASCGHILD